MVALYPRPPAKTIHGARQGDRLTGRRSARISRLGRLPWPGGRVVMQRTANPCTSVRFRPGPPKSYRISPSGNCNSANYCVAQNVFTLCPNSKASHEVRAEFVVGWCASDLYDSRHFSTLSQMAKISKVDQNRKAILIRYLLSRHTETI